MTRAYSARKFVSEKLHETVDSLTIEEPLRIKINGKAFTVTMRTPGDDESLVYGLLFSEGILMDVKSRSDLLMTKATGENMISSVDLSISEKEISDGYINSRSLLSVSSCGICGRTELDDLSHSGSLIQSESSVDVKLIHRMFQKMNTRQFAFHQSGGTHAAAAFKLHGELLCSKEDIGRHNAVDKVIGDLILTDKLDQASCLTVSGRVSYEIVIKCFKAGIPILAAVSAPSSLAVDYAKEFGITLLAFCRDKRATCYSHPRRIRFNE